MFLIQTAAAIMFSPLYRTALAYFRSITSFSFAEADMVGLRAWVWHSSRTSCQGLGLTALIDVVDFFLQLW